MPNLNILICVQPYLMPLELKKYNLIKPSTPSESVVRSVKTFNEEGTSPENEPGEALLLCKCKYVFPQLYICIGGMYLGPSCRSPGHFFLFSPVNGFLWGALSKSRG